jgi:hypothetical protein
MGTTDVGSSRDDQVNEKEPTPVLKRVTLSERLRAEVDEVFAGGADLATAIEQVARIGARLLLQTAIEVEATEFLGRERYACAASCDGARDGYCDEWFTIHTRHRDMRDDHGHCCVQHRASTAASLWSLANQASSAQMS